jgi:hypothetical protein
VKEEERKKRQATKAAIEQGAWVTTGTKVEKKVEKEMVKVAKNGFAALDSDTEEEVEAKVVAKVDVPWGKQKIDWAADSDDE